MVTLQRPSRYNRNSGFNTRYITLLLAATMGLVLWGYQKIYFGNASKWLLTISIALAVVAFALAIYHIVKVWRNHKKTSV